MKRVAIYMRVSTGKQAQEGDSIPAQRDALHKYIDSHPDMICVGEYLDDGISGTKEDRDELQRMLSDVKAGKIDLIIVTKLDRLYRSIRHYLNLQDTLDKCGVNWLAIWEPIYDTSTPQGRLIINQMMSIAQFEAENTAQRIKSVFAYKASVGEVLSGKQPFGYSIVNKRLVPDENADAMREIFMHYAKTGMLLDTLRFAHARGFRGEYVNLKNMLQNEKYIGKYRDNLSYCQPIVDRDIFDQVQRQLEHTIKYNVRHTYIFSGLVKCPMCGHPMAGARFFQYNYKKDGSRVLTKKENSYSCGRSDCDLKTKFLERKIEKYLLDHTEDMLLEAETKQKPLQDVSRQRDTLIKKMDRLKDLYIEGLISIEEYKADRDNYEQQLKALKQPEPQTDINALRATLSGPFKTLYADFSPEEKRYFWRSLVRTITPSRPTPLSRQVNCEVDFL